MAIKTTLTAASRDGAELAGLVREQYGGALLRYLLRYRGCAQDVDDLAQEVYMELLRVPEPAAVRQPQAYLYRIASHVVYRFKRRRQRDDGFVTFDSETVESLSEHAPVEAAEESGRQLDAVRELERLLSALPPLYQAILLMRKRDGSSYAQIAEKLGISVHTVKKYLHRAMVQMRSAAWDDASRDERS